MPSEKEAKFKVGSHAAVRRALKRAGAVYLGTVLQTDRYLDFPDGSLRRSDRGLRIRTVHPLPPRATRRGEPGREDLRPLLTFKGPRRPGRIKIRSESQTYLDDADAMVEVLRPCGLAVSLTLQKRRASYRLGRCRVELDELPLLGRFVEIEGADEKTILAAARKLGLTGEPIPTPYTHLIADYCRLNGITSTQVRFGGPGPKKGPLRRPGSTGRGR